MEYQISKTYKKQRLIVSFLVLVPFAIMLPFAILFSQPSSIDIWGIILIEGIILLVLIKEYRETMNNYGRLRISILEDSICLIFPSIEMKYTFDGIKKIVIGQKGDKALFIRIFPKQGAMRQIRGIDNIDAFTLDLRNKIPSALLKVERNHII